MADRMRVIITQHLRPAISRCAMRIDQSLWVDLEMCLGRWMDIASGNCLCDASAFAQQDTAAFLRVGGASFPLDQIDHFSCHFDVHRAWP